MKIFFQWLIIGFVFTFTSCGSAESSYGVQIEEALKATKEAKKDLLNVSTREVKDLYEVTSDLKEEIKRRINGDTLSASLGVAIDAILVSQQRLFGLKIDHDRCSIENKKLQRRLERLNEDIQSGAGDRSLYFKYVSKETKLAKVIRKQAMDIRKRFETARQTIREFKPELDKYISKTKSVTQR